MKRIGFLTEQIADMENLRLAFYKAQRAKNTKREVRTYREALESNLLQLREEILAGQVRVGDYHLFKIYDPKERTVCAAAFRERVLHHALMNVCAPYFERQMVETTYANRLGKGVYKALERAACAVNRYTYVAKLDVRKYFDNIDQEILTSQLRRIFKDGRLLTMLGTIIRSYCVENGKGVPIGNLTSQYFANFYLSQLDHYAKEILQIPEYVRYMDDILVFGNELNVLKDQVKGLKYMAYEQLLLELKPPVIQPTMQTIAFLGYRLGKHYTGLTQRSRKRFENKYITADRALTNSIWTEHEVQEHILPLFAFVRHAYTKQYRADIINKVTGRRVLTA